jgi:hypothetical protein
VPFEVDELELQELHALRKKVGPVAQQRIDDAIAKRLREESGPRYRPSSRPAHLRREKDVEQDIDSELERLGFSITRLSQARASKQTPGIPDRYARHIARKRRIWIEVKQPGGELTADQKAWQKEERDAGGEVITVWSVEDLQDELRARGFNC